MSKGVEWSIHTLLNLDVMGGGPVGSGQLAEAHGLPAPYLNKQLQLLVRGGLLTSTPGPRGGFRLARPLSEITLFDVVEAIEGDTWLFQCTEIRCCGRIGELAPSPTSACAVKTAMRRADQAWHQALKDQTVGEIQEELDRSPEIRHIVRSAFS
ncbi:RrF2 family transcriptional regulator [Streptomyces sp. NPDC002911]